MIDSEGFCKKHGIKMPHCKTCEAAILAKRPMHEKILDVLSDNKPHTLREIAEQTGLLRDNGEYPDVARSARSLRDEEKGMHPVHVAPGNPDIYTLLTPDEAERTRFWEKQAEKNGKKTAKSLENEISELRKQLAKKDGIIQEQREEIQFLYSYIKEAEVPALPVQSVA